jgi:selenobiotic family peptide radical SAM maturase
MFGKNLSSICPVTSTFLPGDFSCPAVEKLVDTIRSCPDLLNTHPFLNELAEIEDILHRLRLNPPALPVELDSWQLRPGVELLEVSWLGLAELLNGEEITPVRQNSFVLLIPGQNSISPRVTIPDNNILLALKIVIEKLDLRTTAKECGTPVTHLQNVLALGVDAGILLPPASKIVRPDSFAPNSRVDSKFLSAEVFTLQWHITQTCDLHCRHCYDRSVRKDVSLSQGRDVLDQLYDFCKAHNVYGQVSFSGGNPLLHPDFYVLYQEAADRGFMTAILGNPADRRELEKLLAIHPPEFYQVSLEGLRRHNDHIRGSGHFNRTMEFLTLLRELDIYSMVMLTLTRANQDQVLPLAEILNARTNLFTFNRLAMVGEGAALDSLATGDYERFLRSYMKAAESNPLLRLKDNLFNILQLHHDGEPGGGCAGHGCGAAFNFVSMLSDGQVHACRKLPSLVGNIHHNSLSEIYHSDIARKYRQGTSGCLKCGLKPVCGGCPAVAYGFGKDIFTDVDPYCFMEF